jgi:hypothetical protein
MFGVHWSKTAIFDDEDVTLVSPEPFTFPNIGGLLCVDGETTPRSQIELFDDGFAGDDVAGDVRWSRGCLRVCQDFLESRNITEALTFSGLRQLGVLHHSLRGEVPVVQLEMPPESECTDIVASSHGVFAVCDSLLPNFPNRDKGPLFTPSETRGALPAVFAKFGDAFDFITVKVRHTNKKDDAPQDAWYSNQNSIWGYGGAMTNRDTEGWRPVPCRQHARLIGIASAQHAVNHELGHGIIHGKLDDYNTLPEYPQNDGHLSSWCNVHGPLQVAIWGCERCTNKSVPFGHHLAANEVAGQTFSGTFRYTWPPKHRQWSKILLYAMGAIPIEEARGETYYCLIHNDNFDDSDPNNIRADYRSFTVDTLVERLGPREPAHPFPHWESKQWETAPNDLRMLSIVYAERALTEAEMTWLHWRRGIMRTMTSHQWNGMAQTFGVMQATNIQRRAVRRRALNCQRSLAKAEVPSHSKRRLAKSTTTRQPRG